MNKAKPFCISKLTVWRAYERVKANKGSAGIDKQSIDDFEENLKGNLYKIWNRMSSGSYFPTPVKTVSIPKKDGGIRKLGIPTISDRIAQMVVKMELEPLVEPIFHADSFGYRPNKSAHQAIKQARQRCWKNAWVVDLDIKGFFDNIDHELLMKAVRKHTKEKWIIMYIGRWLKAGVIQEDGRTIENRQKGTPQGGVISPLLANLYLHYAFDLWITMRFPCVKFERYADDIIIHCRMLEEAEEILVAVRLRMQECRLELHPEKTKIVFCRNFRKHKNENYPEEFDFLGFTFKQRTSRNLTGNIKDGFLPAVSKNALQKMKEEIRRWQVGKASDLSLKELSEMYNPTLRGWVNYYSVFYPQAMKSLRQHWHHTLVHWATRKYKRFKGWKGKAEEWIYSIECRDPKIFAIWQMFHPEMQVGLARAV